MHLTPKPGKGKSRSVSSAKRQNRCYRLNPPPHPPPPAQWTWRPALHRWHQVTRLTGSKRCHCFLLAQTGCEFLFSHTCVILTVYPSGAHTGHAKHSRVLLYPASPREASTGGDTHLLPKNTQVWEAVGTNVLSNEALETLSCCGNSGIPCRGGLRLKYGGQQAPKFHHAGNFPEEKSLGACLKNYKKATLLQTPPISEVGQKAES